MEVVLLQCMPERRSAIMKMCISPDGSLIASGLDDETVVITDASFGREIYRLEHGGRIIAVCFSQGGSELMVEIDNGTVVTWDVASGRMLQGLYHQQ